ncbi:peptidase MA family metallohydrolase [Candidatus Leptofilum sp.]|uniref:peptidase MA family metallohydrolase n=1 Tax=Candidatus Leptofilum sp. TaxID=3241576 RepID=UPI003B58B768
MLQKDQFLAISFVLLFSFFFAACSGKSSSFPVESTSSPSTPDDSSISANDMVTATSTLAIALPTPTQTPIKTAQVLTLAPSPAPVDATPIATGQPAATPGTGTPFEPHTITGIHLSLQVCQETLNFILYCTDFDKSVVPFIVSQLETDYERITSHLQHQPSEKIIVEIYPNLQSYHESIGLRQGSDWLVGGAWSGMMGLVTPLNPGPAHTFDTIMGIATHELVHLIVDEMSDAEIPVWLNEGIATYESGQRQTNFIITSIESGLPAIGDLDFSSGIESSVIYAFSYTIVEFIVQEFGYDTLIELVKLGGGFEESLGISESEFENAWHQFLMAEYGSSSNN